MEDEIQLNQTKPNRKTGFSLFIPVDLNGKVEYIKKRTFLSKQQIILMSCAKNIEAWCKQLMDEELEIRTKGGKVPSNSVPIIPPMPIDFPGRPQRPRQDELGIALPSRPMQYPPTPIAPPRPQMPIPAPSLYIPSPILTEATPNTAQPTIPTMEFKEDVFIPPINKEKLKS